jgi:hypothetical protein
MTEVGFIGSEGGVSDLTFANRLRELLRDQPVPANEQTSGNGQSTNFQLNRVPVYLDQYIQVVITAGGIPTPVPVVLDRNQLNASNCFIDAVVGQVVFGSPPAVGNNNIAVQHMRVRWTDGVLIASLYGGLRQLFPALFKRQLDTSITMQVNQWVYQLPQDFWDPRVQIISAWIREVPSSVNRPIPISGVYRMGLDQVQIPTSQVFTPGATLFLEYKSPYRSLSELEPQAYDLPLFYAAGQLLGFDEARRSRIDTQSPAAEASANPPGTQQNAGQWYMTQFRQMLAQQTAPPMRLPRPISTYSY